jgi:hypothetical protein
MSNEPKAPTLTYTGPVSGEVRVGEGTVLPPGDYEIAVDAPMTIRRVAIEGGVILDALSPLQSDDE